MRNHPGRFQALAVVPPWGSKAMLREAERCIKELGFGGVQMAANRNKFHPVREWLEALPPHDGERRSTVWLQRWNQ